MVPLYTLTKFLPLIFAHFIIYLYCLKSLLYSVTFISLQVSIESEILEFWGSGLIIFIIWGIVSKLMSNCLHKWKTWQWMKCGLLSLSPKETGAGEREWEWLDVQEAPTNWSLSFLRMRRLERVEKLKITLET
jgi:hypothetical protein